MRFLNFILAIALIFYIAEKHINFPYDFFIGILDGYKIEKTTEDAPWGSEKVNYIIISNKRSEPVALIIRSLEDITLQIIIKRSHNYFLLWEKDSQFKTKGEDNDTFLLHDLRKSPRLPIHEKGSDALRPVPFQPLPVRTG